ncbi:MAG: TolB family protein [Bacteroidota bacterium]
MKYLLKLLILVLVSSTVFSQAKVRKLPTSINHPSLNLYSPFISADANALVFISDNAEDNALTPFYTFRDNADWREPQVLPKNIQTRLNFLRGFALSADGKRLYYTTIKQPGVGGYDIWSSDWKGSSWGDPVNLAMPINSKGHEACPSFTPDGNTIYFMRCIKMDQNKAESCKLFRAKKKSNGQWEEPEELPANVNTGNSQTPRIMADGETLIFASDKIAGGKGGMDLYISKFVNANWSNPVPLDFVNTDKDDQYISVAALGRYLLKDAPGSRKNEILEYLIPNEIRPKGMMKVDGKVLDPTGKAIPSYISLIDLATGKRVYNGRPNPDGSFLLYVLEGSRYELSIDPEQGNVSYFAKQFDLTTDKIPQVEKMSAILKSLSVGDELPLDMVKFKPNSSELDVAASSQELKRLVRVVNGNPAAKFEIQVLLTGYLEDSIQSSPDLTEVIIDSIKTQFDDIDSLGQLYKRDSVMVKTTYHNDRTLRQAQAIIDYLVSQGGKPDNFRYFGNAIPAALPENRKTVVKAVLR